MKNIKTSVNPIYLDFHATTPMDPRVLKDMMPYLTNVYGNPSSIDHSYGYDAANIVQTSRETIASAIHAHMDEIIFTSGATESDNLALKGVMAKNIDRGNHLIFFHLLCHRTLKQSQDQHCQIHQLVNM